MPDRQGLHDFNATPFEEVMKAYINGNEINFDEGETILAAAKRNGYFIPSLCAFQPLNHTPGTCRVCLVEITRASGETMIVTSCNTPMEENMRVRTRTARVRSMQRMQVEMLMADHDQNCTACSRHGNCELQDLGLYVGLTENRFMDVLDKDRPVDRSATALVRDLSKCVRCLRCVEVCRQVQGIGALTLDGIGTSAAVGIAEAECWGSSPLCVQCGQCTLVCPTGALSERDETDKVLDYLNNPDIITVFQFAPAVRVVLGEEFGIAPGSNVIGQVITALRQLGADIILDTDFAADVVIMEEGTELLHKLQHKDILPMFTSCCPGWVNYAEKHYPEILPYISSTRSPQQVFGSLARTYLPEKMEIPANKIRVISIMPCTAKKDEAARPNFQSRGYPDVNVVLTIREFARLLRRQGIDIGKLEPSDFDNPFMSESTGAGTIFGSTGGVMEAAVRTVYHAVNGTELEQIELTPLRGLDGVREAVIDLGNGTQVHVAVCHGLKNAGKIVEQVLAGNSPYHFIEVMACPGGCIDGGGTCRVKNDYQPHAAIRQQALYSIDRKKYFRQSHNNRQVQKLYAEFLERPNSPRAHELLHTDYTDRKQHAESSIRELWSKLTLTD